MFGSQYLERNSQLRSTIKRTELSKTIIFSQHKFLLKEGTVFHETIDIKPQLEVFLGKKDNINYWAVDINQSSAVDFGLDHFHPLRPILFSLPDFERSLVGFGASIIDWNIKNKFCSQCGSSTIGIESGFKRNCNNENCTSRSKVQNTSYPRTDGVVIAAVESPDGQKLLLGRQKTWDKFRYSCVGFIEPGETLEEAVAREVYEETGIKIDSIRYHSSQPWPFPSQLMVGFICTAKNTDICLIDEELEDAQWFDREEIQKAFGNLSTTLKLPPKYAIAHNLIMSWLRDPTPKF